MAESSTVTSSVENRARALDPGNSDKPMAESWATSPATRRSMQANRSRDTGPEVAVRRAVHRLGLRYRVDVRPLPAVRRRADLVVRRAQVAVFIDGCWWHGCPDHYRAPRANSDYWSAKVARNQARDLEIDRALGRGAGSSSASGNTRTRAPRPARIAQALRSISPGGVPEALH